MKRKQLLTMAAVVLTASIIAGCSGKASGAGQTGAAEDTQASSAAVTELADEELQEEAEPAGSEQSAEEPQAASTEAQEAAEGEAQIANPWQEAQTAQEAGENAGVGYFKVPEDGTETGIGPLNWYGFQYMENLAEADGAIGAADLTVRKGLKQESEDVSGDYTAYAYEWNQTAGDWNVHCFGNEEGSTMKAVWLSDNFSYSFIVRGQGDLYDTFGLEAADVELIVSSTE